MADQSLILIQKENFELSKENKALKATVVSLLEQIKRLSSPNPIQKINRTTEHQIIEDQVAILYTMSQERALSLEETRALDLLIKNKRLLDENKPIEPDYTKMFEGQTESDLLRIAGNVEPEKPKGRSKSKTGTKDPVE